MGRRDPREQYRGTVKTCAVYLIKRSVSQILGINPRHQSREEFTFDTDRNVYVCPQGVETGWFQENLSLALVLIADFCNKICQKQSLLCPAAAQG